MTHGTPFYLILILFNLLTQPIALATCCSLHGGICNKEKCCDNTPLSTDCGDIRLIKLPPLASLTLPQASEPTKSNKAQPESQSVIPPPSWLYIWQDQKTGRRYLSSTFPPWYRNHQYTENYPTVKVYDENNRLIDNTEQKTSNNDQVIRQHVEKQQQQRVDYQKAQAKESQAQTQQTYLADLLKQWAQQEKQWIETQKITPSMTRLLAELAEVKEVVISMTEEQVKQAWGKPSSETVTLVDNQHVKTWVYPNGKQVILQAGRVQAIKR